MKKKFIIGILIILFLLFLSIILLFKYSHSITYVSDNVSGILEAHSFLNGNVLLHSFALSTDNFYLTDLPFYILYEIFAGINPLEISFVPILIYSLLIIFSSFLVSLDFKDIKSKLTSIVVTIILLGFPSFFLLDQTLMGQIHIGTILYIIISFIFLKLFYEKNNYWYLIPLFISEFIYLLSDPLSIWIGALPIIVTSLILLKQHKKHIDLGISSIFITTLNIILTKLAIPFIQSIGGFHIVSPQKYQFSHLSKIPERIYFAINSIFYYFGAHFFGKKLFLPSTFEEIVKALMILLLLYFIYKVIKEKKFSIINILLLSAIIFNLSAFIFSNLVKNMSFGRYMIPFVIFSFIFIAINLVPLLKNRIVLYISILFSLFFIFSFIYRVGHFPNSPTIHDNKKLVQTLRQNHLKYGIGTYWDSSITTALSSNKIKVRAVLVEPNMIYPLIWLSSTKWYREKNHKFNFFIFGENKYDKTSMDYSVAVMLFGKPYKVYHISNFTLLIWKHSINDTLNTL